MIACIMVGKNIFTEKELISLRFSKVLGNCFARSIYFYQFDWYVIKGKLIKMLETVAVDSHTILTNAQFRSEAYLELF